MQENTRGKHPELFCYMSPACVRLLTPKNKCLENTGCFYEFISMFGAFLPLITIIKAPSKAAVAIRYAVAT